MYPSIVIREGKQMTHHHEKSVSLNSEFRRPIRVSVSQVHNLLYLVILPLDLSLKGVFWPFHLSHTQTHLRQSASFHWWLHAQLCGKKAREWASRQRAPGLKTEKAESLLLNFLGPSVPLCCSSTCCWKCYHDWNFRITHGFLFSYRLPCLFWRCCDQLWLADSFSAEHFPFKLPCQQGPSRCKQTLWCGPREPLSNTQHDPLTSGELFKHFVSSICSIRPPDDLHSDPAGETGRWIMIPVL